MVEEKRWTEAWTYTFEEYFPTHAISADGSIVAVVTRDSELIVFDRSGSILWRFRRRGLIRFCSMRYVDVSADGSTVAACGDHFRRRLHVFDRDGRLLWRRNVRNHGRPLISPDGARILATDGRFLCLFGRDGQLRWKHPVGDRVIDTTASDDLGLISARANNGHLAVLDRDGGVVYERPPGPSAEYSEEVSPDGRLVCAVLERTRMGAISPAGELLWEYEAPDTIVPISFAGDSSLVAVGSNDGTLAVLHGDGRLAWEHKDKGWVYPVRIARDSSLIVAGWNDKVLRTFDMSGRVLWEHVAGEQISGGRDEEFRVAVSSDGSIVAAGLNDGNFILLARDGEILFRTTAGPYIGAPEISEDGSLIATDISEDNMTLTVLELKS